MFKPEEWTRTENIQRGHRVYINNHIQLHKTRISFTQEQQRLLDEYYAQQQEVKIYRRDEQ
jgi:hypothetical protein